MKRFLGTIAAIALALTALVGVQPASATTTCATARQAAMASALSLGDISLAAKAQVMCNSPCESIYSFYLLPNLSSYVETVTLDAYKTCLAAGTGGTGGNNGGTGGGTGGGTPCGSKVFTRTGSVKILGTAKTGYGLDARASGWSPAPSSIRFDWYRDGKLVVEDTDSIYLDSTDIGKKLAVKATAALSCYKSSVVTSVSTKAVTKNTLPKLKASQIKLLVQQDHISDPSDVGTTVLRLTSKLGDFWFEKEPVWTMSGDRTGWASNYQGYIDAQLPTFSFSDQEGGEYQMCINGNRYKIGVTMTVGIIGKYDAIKVTFPVKQYVCVSDSESSIYTANF